MLEWKKRIFLRVISRKIAEGMTINEALALYPELTEEEKQEIISSLS